MLAATAATAAAPVLVAGIYTSTGQVASNNGSAGCNAVGLTANAPNNSVINYPGASKAGFVLYVPSAGALQLCTGFKAIPAGGLNGFSSNASCAIYSVNGNIPAETVNFAFKATTTSANSGVGTTTVTIPATAPIGGGCTATVNTTIVRSGK
jgi:hypothetical protein